MQRFSLRNKDDENLLDLDSGSNHSDEDLLPKLRAYKRPQLKPKDFLKLYLVQNEIHGHDREKATSIISNLNLQKMPKETKGPRQNVREELQPIDLFDLG